MGLNIKSEETENGNIQYQLKSTISEESYHPNKEWVSEDEVKKILIEDEFNRFIESVIKIDMTFPTNYHINGECGKRTSDFNRWTLEVYDDENPTEVFINRYKEIINRLKIDLLSI